jgi:DNA-binding CsgD family transcriptional regulator
MRVRDEHSNHEADQAKLVSAISELVGPFDTWCSLLGRLRQIQRGKISMLASYLPGDRHGHIHAADNVDPHYLRSYPAYDPWAARAKDLAPPGTIWINDEVLSDAERASDRFYNEWLKPQGISHVMRAVIHRDDDQILYVDVGRGDEAGGYDQNDVDTCRSLLPKLQRAAVLQLLIDHPRRRSEATLSAFDMLPIGVLIVDSRNQPVIVNRYARNLLPAWRSATADLPTLLQHRPTSCEQAVYHNGTPVSRMAAVNGSCLISIPRPENLHPLSALIFHLSTGVEERADDGAFYLVFISDPDHGIAISRERLERIYGLTPAEARLAAMIGEGGHLKTVAAQLGITSETARTHLKRIFSKTTVATQADLVRLLLTLTTQIGCLLGITIQLDL